MRWLGKLKAGECGLFWGVLLAGCVGPTWLAGGGKQTSAAENANVTLDVPAGWMRLNRDPSVLMGKKDRKAEVLMILVRDGVTLQNVHLLRQRVDGDLEFSKKKLAKDLLPQEFAEALYDDVRSDPNKGGQELLESAPAQVGGQPGFRLAYRYTTKGGLQREAVQYGTIREPWLYSVLYDAPMRHYFKKSLADFEHMRESLSFGPGGVTR